MDTSPSTLSMSIIARTVDAIYVRLPAELQRDCGGCDCAVCKVDPSLAKWDTLVVPTSMARRHDNTHTVHMPDKSIQSFKDHRSTNNDPEMIPRKVIDAICKAWPDQAVAILADLRFSGDHYSFNRWGMYVGVEFDGHIHT